MKKITHLAGISLALLGLAGTSAAQAQAGRCANASEVTAIRVSTVQQELTNAALACGPSAVESFNRYQRTFQRELRRSDAVLLSMFKRIHGASRGNTEYDAFKTRTIAHAELRRTTPGQHDNFCAAAAIVFEAALAPDKPVLEDFVSGVSVQETNPVSSCEIKVAIGFQGLGANPGITPTARPALPGDVPPPA